MFIDGLIVSGREVSLYLERPRTKIWDRRVSIWPVASDGNPVPCEVWFLSGRDANVSCMPFGKSFYRTDVDRIRHAMAMQIRLGNQAVI